MKTQDVVVGAEPQPTTKVEFCPQFARILRETRHDKEILTPQEEAFMGVAPKKRSKPSEPIKDVDDIKRVIAHFIRHGQYRDNLIFVIGITTGLRCGDILKLRVGHLLGRDGKYLEKIVLKEEKTQKTRTVFINEMVMDAADLYFGTRALDINEMLFRAEGHRGSKTREQLSVRSVEDILKKAINQDLGISAHAGTHLMRKTFAYHAIMSAPDRSRSIEILQKMFGHSSARITLDYAGITDDEISEVYKNLYGSLSVSDAYLSSVIESSSLLSAYADDVFLDNSK